MSFGFFSLFAFLVVLTPVVFIHELGHFWAARRSGVTVEVFSVGFGPELLGYTDRHGTRWKFSAVPLGGYVKMVGDSDATSAPSSGSSAIKGSFQSASLMAKAFIVAMGPIANFILGIAIFAAVFMAVGKPITPAEIGEVRPGSVAAVAGIKAGDRITAINGNAIDDFGQVRAYVFESPGREMLISIDRDGRRLDLSVIPDIVEDECLVVSYGRLGVVSVGGEIEKLAPVDALTESVVGGIDMSFAMLRGIGRIVTGNSNKGEIGGPVKIAEISGRVASEGWVNLMLFVAIISINLGLVNLLPVPSLDGGHLMFFGIEAMMGRPLNEKIQGLIMRVGMVFLIGLIVLVTAYDILNLGSSKC
jgi:regulator of sigma E protease